MCLLKTNFRYKLLRILTTQIGPKSLMTPSVTCASVLQWKSHVCLKSIINTHLEVKKPCTPPCLGVPEVLTHMCKLNYFHTCSLQGKREKLCSENNPVAQFPWIWVCGALPKWEWLRDVQMFLFWSDSLLSPLSTPPGFQILENKFICLLSFSCKIKNIPA